MTTKSRARRPSSALRFLEKITGGPLTLPELLVAIRKGETLSCVEFARKLGISRSHLCDIERGRKSVSLGRAIEFAETLGYSKDQFARLALQTQVYAAGLRYKVILEG